MSHGGDLLLIDVAGFTALTEAHSAEAAADLVDRFTNLVRSALASNGRFIDRIGDAAFVITPQPDDAVSFITQLFDLAANEPNFPALRAGLHHGEALERDNSYYGTTINVAARVAAQAGGNQVVATALVAKAARRQGVEIENLGLIALRNVRESIALFALHALARQRPDVVDPVCRMRVHRQNAAGQLHHGGRDYCFCDAIRTSLCQRERVGCSIPRHTEALGEPPVSIAFDG